MFKPDLVAPGNKLTTTLAAGSTIATDYPELVVVDGTFVKMSGSSMAAAVVSGTVARMLDANGELNPNIVKLILLSTAIKMPQPAMLEQGNGMVNAKTAKSINMRNRTVGEVTPTWTLSGEFGDEQVWAGGAFA